MTKFRTSLLLIVAITVSSFSYAQELTNDSIATADTTAEKEKKVDFKLVPYLNYDRSLGLSGGIVPMIMYKMNKNDTISPASMTGALGFYTTNNTWFTVLFSKMYFNEDKYRATLVGGLGSMYYQFYLDDPINPGNIDYNTGYDFFLAELQRKVINNLYVGLNFKYAKLVTLFDIPGAVEEVANLYGLGGVVAYDGRDDVYYPHKGQIVNLNYTSFPGFMGNELISNKIELDYNQFFEMPNKRDVLAIRFFGGAGIGDLDFNQQYIVEETDIRGYTQGKFRGEQKVTIQGEYRWNPFEKIGFVGFAGVASVFSGINADDNGKLLPAIGTGFRYNVFPENHMNIGMDFAVGLDDWGMYFRIGEAF